MTVALLLLAGVATALTVARAVAAHRLRRDLEQLAARRRRLAALAAIHERGARR